MGTLFTLGFLFGLRHALDADHIAAVATLATRADSARETIRVGLAWGLGHAAALVGGRPLAHGTHDAHGARRSRGNRPKETGNRQRESTAVPLLWKATPSDRRVPRDLMRS